jgi:hypothetical protein
MQCMESDNGCLALRLPTAASAASAPSPAAYGAPPPIGVVGAVGDWDGLGVVPGPAAAGPTAGPLTPRTPGAGSSSAGPRPIPPVLEFGEQGACAPACARKALPTSLRGPRDPHLRRVGHPLQGSLGHMGHVGLERCPSLRREDWSRTT